MRATVEARNAALALPRKGREALSIVLDTCVPTGRPAIRCAWRPQAPHTANALMRGSKARMRCACCGRAVADERSGCFRPAAPRDQGQSGVGQGKAAGAVRCHGQGRRSGFLRAGRHRKVAIGCPRPHRTGGNRVACGLASLRLGKTQGSLQAHGALPFAARPLAVQAAFDVLDLAAFAAEKACKVPATSGSGHGCPVGSPFPTLTLRRAARVVAPGAPSQSRGRHEDARWPAGAGAVCRDHGRRSDPGKSQRRSGAWMPRRFPPR